MRAQNASGSACSAMISTRLEPTPTEGARRVATSAAHSRSSREDPDPLPDEHARVRAGRRRVEREDEAIARVEARRVVRHLHRAGVEIGRAADVVQRHAVDVAGIAVVRVFKPGGDAARADDHPSPEESEEMVGFLPLRDANLRRVAPNASSISFAKSALAPFSSAVLSRPCQK